MSRLKCLRPVLAPAPVNGWKPDSVRGSRHQRGYGTAWERTRARILRRDGGLCQPCQSDGHVTGATEVDHIVPKAQGGGDNDENLQAICIECHSAKTARESRGSE